MSEVVNGRTKKKNVQFLREARHFPKVSYGKKKRPCLYLYCIVMLLILLIRGTATKALNLKNHFRSFPNKVGYRLPVSIAFMWLVMQLTGNSWLKKKLVKTLLT